MHRYQLGESVPVMVRMEFDSYEQIRPDIAVRATVMTSAGSVVETLYMHPDNIFTSPSEFHLMIHTNNGLYVEGQYMVFVTTEVTARTVGTTRRFELVGADDTGAVIGLTDYQFQTGEHTVFQRDDGELLVGRRPH